MELEKHITDERTGISYTLCGEIPSRFMRKIICRLRLNEVSRQ